MSPIDSTAAPGTLVIVDPSVDVTGAFMCARTTARILKDDLEVCLILPAGSRIPSRYLEDFSTVHYLPMRQLRRSLSSLLLYLPMLLYSSWKLRMILRSYPDSVLQMNDFYLLQGVGARLLGYRGALFTWVRMDPGRFGALLSRIWLGLGNRFSRSMVAVSEFIRQRLPFSLAESAITVHDPVPLDDPAERMAAGCNTADRRLVFIGNYIRGKGQDLALRAFLDIAEDYPDASLHFHGGDMGLPANIRFREALQAMARRHPCGHRVIFHDFVDDVAAVYGQSCVALNCSDSESFSLTVLEACFYGLPVIATRSGGPQEIIEDGRTGLLVPTGDVQAISEAMRHLLDDDGAAREMGRAAGIHVREKFSPGAFRERLLELYGGGFRRRVS